MDTPETHYAKRGTGLSDRVFSVPTLEERMDDVRAVMDAAGSDRAALLGWSEGGAMSLLFAATYPDRTRAPALYASYAHCLTWVRTLEETHAFIEQIEHGWGTGVALQGATQVRPPTKASDVSGEGAATIRGLTPGGALNDRLPPEAPARR
jgi:pimeloyl-ACP methyl ester carboxylesterase